MSLDLYIISKTPVKHKGVEDGVFWHNDITNNLLPMATQCVITYNDVKVSLRRLLWEPKETGLLGKNNEVTEEYINALSGCLGLLIVDKAKYVKYNPANGLGSYEGLKDFVTDLVITLNEIKPENYNNYTVEAEL